MPGVQWLDDAVLLLADPDATGGVLEDRAVLLRPGEQRPQGDQGVLALRAVNGAQVAEDVVAGDLAQVVVAVGPFQQHRPDSVEVAPDRVHVPGVRAGAAVVQEPGPRLDVAADTGREAVELALQPLVERRGPVVVEDADVVEHLRGAFDAEPP